VTLVADRFLLTDTRTIDLATGDDVQLIMSTAGGPTDQARWLARCDRFFALRHWAIASLVDFGLCGECQRFEAWQVGESLRPMQADVVVGAASAFLAACGCTPLTVPPAIARARDGRAVVVPDAGCGYERATAASHGGAPITLGSCGVRVVARAAIAHLADLFSDIADTKPRTIALWGPPGSGIRTASRELARAARLQGFVPLAVSLPAIAAPLRRAVADRSLFLIHTRTREMDAVDDGWRALLAWVMSAGRGHVLFFAGRSEVARVAGLPLAPLTEEQLVSMVEPACTDEESRRRVADAARRAKGVPGRFVERLWPATPHSASDVGAGGVLANRVAESQPTYGDGSTADAAVASATGHALVTWPPSGECLALGRRVDEATTLMSNGRRAAGERLLRQTVGALARRRNWPEATRGALVLAGALLRRGRTAEAGTVLQLARAYLQQTRNATPLWLEAVILSGHHATDAGRFDEAESILFAGFDAARSTRSGEQEALLRLALARCLFWRGRFDDAYRFLQPLETDRPDASAVRIQAALSRVAVGQRQLDAAVTRAAAALAAAHRTGDARLMAHAGHALAFAHLAVGDLDGVLRDGVEALAAARAARCPLTTIKLRLLQAEAVRRQGPTSAVNALVHRIERLARVKLPATIRARVGVLGSLVAGASATEAVRRSPCAQALALFAPVGPPGAPRDQLPVDDMVDILRCCQVADDAGTVLRAVCEKVRTRLHAAATAFISPAGVVIAFAGARIDRRMTDRVLAIGETIPPHAWEGNVEGGAPVRYGGAVIAALVARWALGAHVEAALGAAALTLAATAAGPLVAEAHARSRDRRDAEAGGRLRSDILGDSRQMHDVRQAIERASTAPFPVLVEGESGSGKELVARAIHRRSPRCDRPFCSMNCAALPDDLVESELFGHARGAFTGAVAERPGVFEEAHTGTLFLDEIGELSMRAQAKVLRTIQEGELRRVGENVSRRVDVRIVAATNRDLRQEVASGRFRLDLLYRLDVLRIAVPPLRERPEDIALLAEVFWQEATSRIGSKAVLAAATVAALARYSWPGNVRELQNVLAATAVRSPRRGVVPPAALPPPFHQAAPADSWRLDDARRSFEERFIRAALVRCGGRRSQTATELGITRQGLTKLMARLGIE